MRSGLEVRNAKLLKRHKVPFEYETMKINWRDTRVRTYRPDFILPNGIIIEAKGRFVLSDRNKHLFVKEQHPELDIRFVFSNPNNKITKGSKTTYGDWCDKHGFMFAAEFIPKEWIEEAKA